MKDFLKGMIAIALLVVATFIVMEIPKKYYEKEDEKLMTYVNRDEYDMGLVEEHMDFTQKIHALCDEKSIIVEEASDTSELGYPNDIVDHRLYDEVNKLFVPVDSAEGNLFPWGEFIKEILRNERTKKKAAKLKVIQVKKGDIYSFKLGVVRFEVDTPGMNNNCVNGFVCFDRETGKILMMEWYVDRKFNEFFGKEFGEEFSQPELVQYDEDGIYVWGEEVNSDVLEAYYDSLTEYYNMDVKIGNSLADITYDYLICSPYRYEGEFSGYSKTMNTIYDFIFNNLR